ncbi:ABC transporter permease [Aquimarina macrocephali]|uniref:ABC transporter permease n=1 Tax=Aquimarina macrocephali TaxID=666563 RepID=UPI000464EE36|nr:ABC transporter permease [Aquimarina macrocephali]
MTAITFYFSSLKNEIIKLKHTFALWLTAICALLIPLLFFIVYTIKWEGLIPEEGVNPWNQYANEQIMNSLPALVPLFIVLITSLIIQIEHKATAIKHLFALPIPKSSVYFGKLSIVIATVFATYAMYYGLILLNGNLLGGIRPQLNFSEFSPEYIFHTKILFRSFISVLGILAIQFWLSFRFKNFIIPLGIGMVLVIIGLIAARAPEAIYFPYSYSVISMNPLDEKTSDLSLFWWFPTVSIYSLIYFLVFSIAGFFDIKRINVK